MMKMIGKIVNYNFVKKDKLGCIAIKGFWNKLKKYDYQKKVRLTLVKFWNFIYKCRNFYYSFKSEYSIKLSIVLMILLLSFLIIMIQYNNNLFFSHFSIKENFSQLKSFYLGLGCALIGSSVIAFTLVMFAMQINVERMPHGLFYKFSSDFKLLSAFLTTFLLALVVAFLSLIPKVTWILSSITIVTLSMCLILILFIYAYRRALNLVSPTRQLVYVLQDVQRNFLGLNKALNRTTPLLEQPPDVKYDVQRFVYFKKYPMWSDIAKRALLYCISYSRRYAEAGDHEISKQSLDLIVAINYEYIKVKGRTFINGTTLLNDPLMHDQFLSETLEHLRQSIQIGLSRGDEQLTQNVLRTLCQLSQAYLNINYGDEHAHKYHSYLASSYLCTAVETAWKHNQLDVVTEGIRLMGEAATGILNNDDSAQILHIAEKISIISTVAAANLSFRSVTVIGVRELSLLTFRILISKHHDIDYTIKEIRNGVNLIVNMCIKFPDLINIHFTCLSSYYSISNDTFLEWLTELINNLTNRDEIDDEAKRIIHHISQWSDDLYRNEKQLTLSAIERQSPLTSDLINWIVHVTKLLLALSTAKACSSHVSEELIKNANWLIHVITWIPDSEEAVTYVEKYELTEKLFEVAEEALRRDCIDIAESIKEILFSWGFTVGKYPNCWNALKRTVYGVATLDVLMGDNGSKLLEKIEKTVNGENSPSLENRLRTVKEIQKYLKEEFRPAYTFSSIEKAMYSLDQSRLQQLLHSLIKKLQPDL